MFEREVGSGFETIAPKQTAVTPAEPVKKITPTTFLQTYFPKTYEKVAPIITPKTIVTVKQTAAAPVKPIEQKTPSTAFVGPVAPYTTAKTYVSEKYSLAEQSLREIQASPETSTFTLGTGEVVTKAKAIELEKQYMSELSDLSSQIGIKESMGFQIRKTDVGTWEFYKTPEQVKEEAITAQEQKLRAAMQGTPEQRLAGLGSWATSGMLSWEDPLGLKSTGQALWGAITGQGEKGAEEALRTKAIATYDLDTALKQGAGTYILKVATGPIATIGTAFAGGAGIKNISKFLIGKATAVTLAETTGLKAAAIIAAPTIFKVGVAGAGAYFTFKMGEDIYKTAITEKDPMLAIAKGITFAGAAYAGYKGYQMAGGGPKGIEVKVEDVTSKFFEEHPERIRLYFGEKGVQTGPVKEKIQTGMENYEWETEGGTKFSTGEKFFKGEKTTKFKPSREDIATTNKEIFGESASYKQLVTGETRGFMIEKEGPTALFDVFKAYKTKVRTGEARNVFGGRRITTTQKAGIAEFKDLWPEEMMLGPKEMDVTYYVSKEGIIGEGLTGKLGLKSLSETKATASLVGIAEEVAPAVELAKAPKLDLIFEGIKDVVFPTEVSAAAFGVSAGPLSAGIGQMLEPVFEVKEETVRVVTPVVEPVFDIREETVQEVTPIFDFKEDEKPITETVFDFDFKKVKEVTPISIVEPVFDLKTGEEMGFGFPPPIFALPIKRKGVAFAGFEDLMGEGEIGLFGRTRKYKVGNLEKAFEGFGKL